MTFSNAADNWISGFLNLQKPSTRASWMSGLNLHIRPAFQTLELEQVTAGAVNQAVFSWHEAGLAPKTIQNLIGILGRLRAFYSLAPFGKAVTAPKAVQAVQERPYFTATQLAAIVGRAAPKYRALFATAAGTGMRAGELLGLRVQDVDLKRGLIHVRQSVWNGEAQSPKTANAYRWMPIDAELVQILRTHFTGRIKEGYVFQARNGAPLLQTNVLRRGLWPVLHALGIPKAGMHAFRHGRVSYLIEQGVALECIKQWIGHGSEEMIRRYTHHRPEFHKAQLPPSVLAVITREA